MAELWLESAPKEAIIDTSIRAFSMLGKTPPEVVLNELLVASTGQLSTFQRTVSKTLASLDTPPL